MLKELVYQCRTFRRFYEDVKLSKEELLELVDMARMTASTANSQALKFAVYHEEEDNEKIFETLNWAGALPEWGGPEKGERPSAYIIVLEDLALGKNKLVDVGITSQTMALGAVEMGYGCCMLMSLQRGKLAENLEIDTEKYAIQLVLALGKPKEEVKVVPAGADGNMKYYRDENQVHYVPKRSLDQVLYKKA